MKVWRDESGLIVSWIVRMLIVFSLFGIAAYDAGSIVVNTFTLDSRANEIALEISTEAVGEDFFNQAEARQRAKELAKEAGARLINLEIERDGTVHVKIRRVANTLVVSRIDAIKDWAKATADSSAAPTK